MYVKGKNYMKCIFYLFIMLGFISQSYAQKVIKGNVQDNDGFGLIGANVFVKNNPSSGTVTDLDGNFELSVSEDAKAIEISYVGFQSQTVELDGSEMYNIVLSSQVQLDEVVVTALGVERSEKALGYSVQKLDGEQISKVKPTNVTNALAGKASGVYVTGSASGPTASSNIVIRGSASLLGNNQPLFVVNGMPITNDLYSFDDGLNGSTTIDFGNAAQIVNPDDIKSMNVLKGPAASALYGARAANGVILIETKTGKDNDGWGVQFNSTTNFQTILKLPNYQNEFGFGALGKYSFNNGTTYTDDDNTGIEHNDAYGENWGPRMNGQFIKQFNSDGEPVPFTPAPDNVRNFFRTGMTGINNIAINHGDENGDLRLSYTNLSNRGIVPNTDLFRNTLQASIGRRLFNDKLTIRANAMYVNSRSNNVPNAGYDESSSVMYGWLWYPRQVAIDELRDYWQPGLEGVQQRYVEGLWVNNPWLIAQENTNSFQANRLISNFRVNYNFTDRISLRFRYGADINEEQRQYRRAPSTQGVLNGSYREDEISFSETNAEMLLSYNSDKTNGNLFQYDVKVGGNIMKQNANFLVANNPELKFFGTDKSIYTLTNSRSGVLVESQKTTQGINSLFGVLSLSYNNWLFLDGTYRHDWNSSLVNPIRGIENSNFDFGYPSLSLSAILSEAFDFPVNSPVSFLKVRAAYAEVGNGAPPFAFGRTFEPQPSFGSGSVFTTDRTIADVNLTNETTRAIEFGVDMRFFKDRLRLDATYYDMNSFNQVINLPVASSSGYDFILTNGGAIRNRGVEVMLGATPVRKEGFSWDVMVNLGHNRAIVESLPDVIESGRYSIVADLFPADGGSDLEFVAEEGQLLGQLYGLGFERGPDGRVIHYADGENAGLPVLTDEKVSAGSFQPDLRLGIYNQFTVGNFDVGILFDGQIGGNIYSRSHALYNTGGAITNEDDPHLDLLTTEGRRVHSVSYDESGNPIYTLEEEGGIVGPGWKWSDMNGNNIIDDGELVENDVEVLPHDGAYTGYFYQYYGNGFNRDNIEAATYDATYFKLRELNIGYNLPKGLVEMWGLTTARISFVGRNLLLFTNVPSIDPETYSIRNGIFVPGFESTQLPSTRSFGFSINVGF